MSGRRTYQDLRNLVTRLRDDLNGGNQDLLLLFAYNRTGKTRLSMEFKVKGKKKVTQQLTDEKGVGLADENGHVLVSEEIQGDTLYFNAFTEDLFTWENDLENDTTRHLKINANSSFFTGLTDLALDETIDNYLSRYADFEFDINYTAWTVSFRKGDQDHIKISRGEENIFIWCLFMAIYERVLDGHSSYHWVKYIYIDDPVSSLDDNNAIAVACDLAKLLRKAASRRSENDEPAPIKVVFSSHHALFFNVMCNEIGRGKNIRHKRYFLHRPNSEGRYTLQSTDDTPHFHHVATLSELQRAADPDKGTLYTFHFNALRSIMEKTASFFGHSEISFCLKALNNEENEALFNRALNLLSHGKYAIHDPTLMGEDNQTLFRQILNDFVTRFEFDLPDILGTPDNQSSPAS